MPANATRADVDAIVVGAGFGGLFMLHKLRNELGLKVRLFDKASGVGGTWYWNRYPGAHSDSEGWVYCYSFDEELLQEWNWSTRFLTQPQVKAYLEHVVERYELGEDLQFNTGVVSAHYDETSGLWQIGTDTGETYTARYFVPAIGVLHAAVFPDIEGRDSFSGDSYHTSEWPEGVELAGKRVGVIGTGSSGVQTIAAIAPEVGHLTVFQRTPQYTVPAANGPISGPFNSLIKANYKEIWDYAYNSVTAFGFKESQVSALSVSEEERRRVFQEAWEYGGGFNFMFGTFNDIATDPVANEAAAAFIREKIQQLVKDPEVARKLTPTDAYAKRPICDSGYYETFNRENVALVDVKANPIREITPRGVRTEDGVEHELDVLVYATGFDGFTGSHRRIDIRGRGNKSLKDQWKDGGTSYLGVSVAGFPNMLTVFGPYSGFSNNVPLISTQVEWISTLIREVEKRDEPTVEVTRVAEEAWVAECDALVEETLFLNVDSWIIGSNVPGKPRRLMFYVAGLASYREKLGQVADNDYEGFVLGGSDPTHALERPATAAAPLA
ncbi:MAG TPA: NAD(P)/FAD-dependent oxidoreductase [Pseudonocardia sp.]|jgi:cation diffusion facilitator CzcD-associated flavoprotein CzcO|nr:NAD(P)/FAD-dependent oxidoreductase [Pseudonocardia sp.]